MSENIQELIQSQAKKAKSAMRVLSRSSVDIRNHALLVMAENLQNSKDKIQAANRIDLDNGEKTGLVAPLMQRLLLDDKKIERMVDNLRQVAALPDPIGAVSMGGTSKRAQNRHSPCAYRCRRRGIRVAPRCDR